MLIWQLVEATSNASCSHVQKKAICVAYGHLWIRCASHELAVTRFREGSLAASTCVLNMFHHPIYHWHMIREISQPDVSKIVWWRGVCFSIANSQFPVSLSGYLLQSLTIFLMLFQSNTHMTNLCTWIISQHHCCFPMSYRLRRHRERPHQQWADRDGAVQHATG